VTGRRDSPRPPISPLQGGRRRGDADPSGRRFVLALIVLLALTALGLWLVQRAGAGPGPAARARSLIVREVGPQLGPCMFAIAGRETGYTYDPRATNWRDRHSDGSHGSFGLFQIGAVHRAAGESVAAFRRRMLDPVANAKLAHRIERGAGLAPWGGRC